MGLFHSKHQKLILRCYPPGKGVDKKPNSSELSYLLYYASTRRVKLEKVAVFLQKKTISDCYHTRLGNLQVTLDILYALIDRCSENLNVFATSVCLMLKRVLLTGDIALAKHVTMVYGILCKRLDSSSFTGDVDFVDSFSDLTSSLIDARKKSAKGKEVDKFDWNLVSLISSKYLFYCLAYNTKLSKHFIQVCVPLLTEVVYSANTKARILRRLKSNINIEDNDSLTSPREFSTKLTAEVSKRIEENVDSVSIDEEKLNEEALDGLRCLFNTTLINQITEATRSIMDYLQKENIDPDWGCTFVDMCTTLIPVQLRFITLATLLSDLTKLSNEGNKGQTNYRVQMLYASYVLGLISSDVNLIGLSISDVIQHFLSLKSSIILQQSKYLSDTEVRDLCEVYSKCVQNISTHVYYVDQVPDSVQEILLKIDTTLHAGNVANESNSNKMERLILDFFDDITKIFYKLRAKPSSIHRSHMKLEQWETSFYLLSLESKNESHLSLNLPKSLVETIQVKFFEVFRTYLKAEFLESFDEFELGSGQDDEQAQSSLDPDFGFYLSESDNFLSSFLLHINDFLSVDHVSKQMVLVLSDTLNDMQNLLGINFFQNFLPMAYRWQLTNDRDEVNLSIQSKDTLSYLTLLQCMKTLDDAYDINYAINSAFYKKIVRCISYRIKRGIWAFNLDVDHILDDISNSYLPEKDTNLNLPNLNLSDIEEFTGGNSFLKRWINIHKFRTTDNSDNGFSGSVELTNLNNPHNTSEHSLLLNSERSFTNRSILGLGKNSDVLSIHSGLMFQNLHSDKLSPQHDDTNIDSSIISFSSDGAKSNKTPRASDLKDVLLQKKKLSSQSLRNRSHTRDGNALIDHKESKSFDISSFLDVLNSDDDSRIVVN